MPLEDFLYNGNDGSTLGATTEIRLAWGFWDGQVICSMEVATGNWQLVTNEPDLCTHQQKQKDLVMDGATSDLFPSFGFSRSSMFGAARQNCTEQVPFAVM